MLYTDLAAFTQAISHTFPVICSIISKEGIGLSQFLKKWEGKVVTFEGDDFSTADFCQEMDSPSLFEPQLLCHVRSADKLKEKKVLLSYLKNPPAGVHFLLSATSAISYFKEGVIFQLAEEKPWQVRKRLEQALVEEAKTEGIAFGAGALPLFLDRVGANQDVAIQELKKLSSYCFPRKLIEVADIKEVASIQESATLWELGEAIFQRKLPLALERGRVLLQEGIAIFVILAHLRTQAKTLKNMALIHAHEGVSALQKAYPYLKGSLLEKKLHEMEFGITALSEMEYILFQKELLAKNSATDPELILETLLCHCICSPTS